MRGSGRRSLDIGDRYRRIASDWPALVEKRAKSIRSQAAITTLFSNHCAIQERPSPSTTAIHQRIFVVHVSQRLTRLLSIFVFYSNGVRELYDGACTARAVDASLGKPYDTSPTVSDVPTCLADLPIRQHSRLLSYQVPGERVRMRQARSRCLRCCPRVVVIPLTTAPSGEPLRPELAAPLDVRLSTQLARCAGGRGGWRLSGAVAVLGCCIDPPASAS